MTKKELLEFIKAEITMSGALQISLPDKEIERIIDNETNALYDKYRDALVEKYTIVPRNLFYTPEFRATRTLKFPPCVKTVDEVQEIKARNLIWGFSDPDITFQRAFTADLWMSPMGGDTIAFRTIQWSMLDMMKSFIITDMTHSWNRPTHTLLITGHDPQSDVYIHLWEVVKGEDLWEDPWVRKWIGAKCKKQVSKMLGLFTYTTIGGVTINSDKYGEEADKEIEECNEFFKGQIVPDWFVTTY